MMSYEINGGNTPAWVTNFSVNSPELTIYTLDDTLSDTTQTIIVTASINTLPPLVSSTSVTYKILFGFELNPCFDLEIYPRVISNMSYLIEKPEGGRSE